MAIVDPTDLANLYLWFDADAVTGLTDGDPVASWPRSGGSAAVDLAQATASKQPTYRTGVTPSGGPVLRFDGVNDTLVTPTATFISNITAFFVTSMSAGDNRVLMDGNTIYRSVIGTIQAGDTTEWGLWANEFFYASNHRPLPLGVLSARFAGSLDGVIRWDGAEVGRSASAQNPGLEGVRIGARYTDERFMGADIAEVIIYSRQLSDAEILDVEAYLTAKWMAGPSGPTATATATATPTGSIAGIMAQPVAATLTVTPTGSVAGVDSVPGVEEATATLTAMPTGAVEASAEQPVTATLTVTPTGSIAAMSDGDLTATLTITPTGEVAGVEGTTHYTSATLTVTPTGSVTADGTAPPRSRPRSRQLAPSGPPGNGRVTRQPTAPPGHWLPPSATARTSLTSMPR